MANVLFTNVRVIDATGAQPYQGEVLVQGNRIARIGRGTRSVPTTGVTVIDGAGATLMPGMCEAHTHFGWTNSKTLDAIQKLPPEEHTLWAAQVAKLYLDHGWTSCVGAATPKPRLVKLNIEAQGEERFTTGKATHTATHYVVKVDIGGLAGVVAPLLGKQPPDTHVWIVGGEAPAFVKSEGPMFLGGPLWRIELASPVWRTR